jgi:hypothetical protein
MSTTTAAVGTDTNYTATLLHYDTQLKRTKMLLATMCAVLPYLNPQAQPAFSSLLEATHALLDSASREMSKAMEIMEAVCLEECKKPNRVFKGNRLRSIVQEEFVALDVEMIALREKARRLEKVRRSVLRKWAMEDADLR